MNLLNYVILFLILIFVTGCNYSIVQPITPNSEQFFANSDCKITNGLPDNNVSISSKDIFYEIIIDNSGEYKKLISRDYHLPAYEVDNEYNTTGKTYAYLHNTGEFISVINTKFYCDKVKFTKKTKP